MKVFLADASHGYLRDLDRDETKMLPFLRRADAILVNFDAEHVDAIRAAHDSRETSEPRDLLCEAPVAQQAPGTIGQPIRLP